MTSGHVMCEGRSAVPGRGGWRVPRLPVLPQPAPSRHALFLGNWLSPFAKAVSNHEWPDRRRSGLGVLPLPAYVPLRWFLRGTETRTEPGPALNFMPLTSRSRDTAQRVVLPVPVLFVLLYCNRFCAGSCRLTETGLTPSNQCSEPCFASQTALRGRRN